MANNVSEYEVVAASNTAVNSNNITGTGLVSTADDSFRAILANEAKWWDDLGGVNTVAGTGDAITVTTPTVYTALKTGIRFNFKASAINTTAVTLNFDAIGAKAVRKISGGVDVALAAGDIPGANARIDVIYDAAANAAAGAWILTVSPSTAVSAATTSAAGIVNLSHLTGPINLGIAASVGSSALTIALKGVDGNDPSASNPVYVPFRNVTAATGTPTWLAITAATSIVISSGSTLGAPTGSVPFAIWLVAFNDGGTLRLGLILCTTLASGILVQYPLGAWGIASSTAEGGAGGADTAQTFYTGSAVTSKAYTVLAVLPYETGLATAGTWAAVPTRAQLFDSSVPLPGDRVGGKSDASSALASTATVMPYDDTIPQNTEGAQFLAPSITPTSAANIMRHAVDADFCTATGAVVCGALFQDSTAGAFAACASQPESGNAVGKFTMAAYSLAGGTSAITYKFRAGPHSANTLYLNGNASGVRIIGGVCSSVYEVQEIAA